MASNPQYDLTIDRPQLRQKAISLRWIAGIWPRNMLRRFRIDLLYFWRHRRLPDLRVPTLFTELVQLRKLAGGNVARSALIDKIGVKEIARLRIGGDWIIPTLWHGSQLPEQPIWPYPFIVKSSHGCNQYAVVRSPDDDWQAIRAKSQRWTRKTYGGWLDEGYYADVDRGLLIEAFVGRDDVLPVDYKIYVFGGKAAFVQVHLDRATNHHWSIFDLDWNLVSRPTGEVIPRPASLAAMIGAAEKLADTIEFVRVDFYEIDGQPLFGEMTFYPGSGLDPFDPPVLDAVMGGLWLAAISDSSPTAQRKHDDRNSPAQRDCVPA
jgi:hypothetical protein